MRHKQIGLKKETPSSQASNFKPGPVLNGGIPQSSQMQHHRNLGNRAVQRMLETRAIQAKLTIGQPNDIYEQEADRVADQVMRMSDAQKQPPCACDGGCHKCPAERSGQEHEYFQAEHTRASDADETVAPPIVHEVLHSPGQPLDAPTKAYMEPRLGHDFGRVRIHTDSWAAESAGAVNAQAYTVGRDVVFAVGHYAPTSNAGQKLIAHELAHVVQQGWSSTHGAINAGVPLMRKAAAPETSTAPPPFDYKRIADQIHKAIAGLGTDEEAVYRALQELNRNQAAIDKLKKVYLMEHKVPLLDDIYNDFGGTELEYALQLLNTGTPGSKQRIEPAPAGPMDAALAAARIRNAVEGMGTDEEAIFAVLLPFKQNTLELQNEYYRLYHEDMRDRLVDELSGSELDNALELLETPYTHYVQEANEKLAGVPFGFFGDVSTYCLPEEKETSAGTKRIYWYDKDYWEADVGLQDGKSICKVKLLPGNSPALAIDAMFNRQDRWKIACAEFVQIVHLYALRHTLGAKRFDERVGRGGFVLEVKRRESTGIETEVTLSRKSPSQQMVRSDTGQPDPRPIDNILAAAPFGSRVRWTNLSGVREGTVNPWEHENTIKLGPDKFSAHGTSTGIFSTSNTHTREEIELLTARGTNQKADMSYVKANIFISEIEIFHDPSRRRDTP